MKPWMRARIVSTGARLGPGGSGRVLYCEMRPQSGMRAPRLISPITASSTIPPTFSKYALQIGIAMIDRRMKAELARQVVALLCRPGDADRAASLEPRDLTDDR